MPANFADQIRERGIALVTILRHVESKMVASSETAVSKGTLLLSHKLPLYVKKANIYAISSDTHQLQFIKLHHF